MGKKEIMKFEGSSLFRTRIILATLINQPIKIKNMNSKDLNPGIKEYQISFIRILDQISNGCIIEFNDTGTDLFYKPGLLTGGAFEHHCNEEKSIGYYLEGILCLAPFVKNPIKARLFGITNDNLDPSVDALKYSTLPLLRKFLNLDSDFVELDIKVVKRCLPQAPVAKEDIKPGFVPKSGEVIFTCPIFNINKALYRPVDLLKPMTHETSEADNNDHHSENMDETSKNTETNEIPTIKTKAPSLIDDYKVTKIRGLAYTLKVSPAIGNRMVQETQRILRQLGCSNNYIRLDNYKKSQCGVNPGFGLILFAETLNGCVYTAEYCSYRDNSNKNYFDSNTNQLLTPEEVALKTTYNLLDEIYMGASVDTSNQTTALMLMALSSSNVSRIITGKLTSYTLQNMKLIEEMLKIRYKCDKTDVLTQKSYNNLDETDMDNMGITNIQPPIHYAITCLGLGYININKTYR